MEGGLGHYKNISINPTVYYTLADEVVLVAFTNFECSSDHKNMSQKPKHKPGSPYEEWASCLEDKMEEFHKPLVEKIKLISQKAEMGELDEETALEKVGDVAKEYAKNIISFLKQL